MALETSDQKIKQICDEISVKTIQPAKLEARKIIENAKLEAQALIRQGQDQKEAILKEASQELLEKNNIAKASLNMAIKQSIEKLKEQIVEKLFSQELEALLESKMNKEEVVAKIIDTMVEAIKSDGLDANLKSAIAKGVDKNKVYAALSAGVKQKLTEENVFVGSFKAGAQVVIAKKNLRLDFTDEAVKEILSECVIDELKETIFNV